MSIGMVQRVPESGIAKCRRQAGKSAEIGEVQAPNLGREIGCRGWGATVEKGEHACGWR